MQIRLVEHRRKSDICIPRGSELCEDKDKESERKARRSAHVCTRDQAGSRCIGTVYHQATDTMTNTLVVCPQPSKYSCDLLPQDRY